MARRTTYLPTTDSGMSEFSANLVRHLPAIAAQVNLLPALVTGVSEAQGAYAAAYALTRSPTGRTPSAVAAKNARRAELVAATRAAVSALKANPLLTHTDRADLGLTVPRRRRRRIGPPATAPVLTLSDRNAPGGWAAWVRDPLRPTHKDKPEGVLAVQVFAAVAEVMPTTPEAWQHVGTFTRCRLRLSRQRVVAGLPPDETRSRRVWFVARWLSPHFEPGPWGQAVCGYTQRGGVTPAPELRPQRLRRAA